MIRLLRTILEYPLGPKGSWAANSGSKASPQALFHGLGRTGYDPGRIDWNARLAADVERRRNSFEIQDYRKRRAAALKGRRAA